MLSVHRRKYPPALPHTSPCQRPGCPPRLLCRAHKELPAQQSLLSPPAEKNQVATEGFPLYMILAPQAHPPTPASV